MTLDDARCATVVLRMRTCCLTQLEDEAKKHVRELELLQKDKERLTSRIDALEADVESYKGAGDSHADEMEAMKKKLKDESVKKTQVRRAGGGDSSCAHAPNNI